MLRVDERISKLELENEALRTHLRLALETIRDPIPETLYFHPPEEEDDADGVDWEDSAWEDWSSVLLDEADTLMDDLAGWKRSVEQDLLLWRGMGREVSAFG
jgi:hypothetical protein